MRRALAVAAHSRKQLAEFGAEHVKTPKACAAVVRALMTSRAGAGLKKGEVRVRGLGRPIDVAREGGRWRIRSTPTGEVD